MFLTEIEFKLTYFLDVQDLMSPTFNRTEDFVLNFETLKASMSEKVAHDIQSVINKNPKKTFQ